MGKIYATHPFLKTPFSTNLHHTSLVSLVQSSESQSAVVLVTTWNKYISLETSSSPLFCFSFVKQLPQVKLMDLGEVIFILLLRQKVAHLLFSLLPLTATTMPMSSGVSAFFMFSVYALLLGCTSEYPSLGV